MGTAPLFHDEYLPGEYLVASSMEFLASCCIQRCCLGKSMILCKVLPCSVPFPRPRPNQQSDPRHKKSLPPASDPMSFSKNWIKTARNSMPSRNDQVAIYDRTPPVGNHRVSPPESSCSLPDI